LTPTHRTRQRISRHSPSPTSHDASASREETIRLSPFLSTRAPADTTTSRTWSSGHIPRSFGLTAHRAHLEMIGLLSGGARLLPYMHPETPHDVPCPWKHLHPAWHLWKRVKSSRRYKREHI
jgi:hypothetical protein